MTQVAIDSPDMSLTDGIKEAVNKTSEKVEKYMDGISLDCVIRKEPKKGIHVLLKFKPSHGAEIQAEAVNGDFYQGLAQAQKRLVRQVTDLKNKRDNQKKHPSEGGTKDISQMLMDVAENEAGPEPESETKAA